MEFFTIPHLMIILIIILIFFGGRRIPDVMRGLGEGIRSFKEGMAGTPPQSPPPTNQAPGSNATQEKK